MSIIQGNAKQASVRGFYPKVINGSLRFNDDDQARLSWYPATDGNRKIWTFSCWVKRSEVTNAVNVIFGTPAEGDQLYFGDSRIFWFNNGSASSYLSTSALFRDPSAWYHIVLAYDTDTQTGSNKVKLWVNGTQYSFDNNTTMPSDDLQSWVNDSTKQHYIGMGHSGTGSTFDGYMAEVHFLNGIAATADDFGELKNGVWVAKAYEGLYDSAAETALGHANGFHLNFQDDTEVEAFNTVLYRGNGGAQSVTGVGFSPDLVWIKNRTGTQWHSLFDPIRGAGERLFSNDISAEDFNAGAVQSWDSDGFTVGDNTSVNLNGGSFVAWTWDAGANNASTGHSSVTYTGNGGTQKISGFPFSPDLLWIKNRDTANSHQIMDSVRGLPNNLETDTPDIEDTTKDDTVVEDSKEKKETNKKK